MWFTLIVTALVTSHNRVSHTLACFEAYFSQEPEVGVRLNAVLVDDGSTDGTADAVESRRWPVRVVRGSGDLYWAAGMALAEEYASREQPDFFLWLNDDVVLFPSSLRKLLATYAGAVTPSLVVGALADPVSQAITYSGVVLHRFHPLRFGIVEPRGTPSAADTFQGNVLLVARRIRERVGAIDGRFAHAGADFDYGLRARKAGIPTVVAAETVGTCARNTTPAPWRDPLLPPRDQWKLSLGPKWLPPRSRARYLRRHGGRLWLIFFLSPYLRVIGQVSASPIRRLGARCRVP